MFIQTNVQMLLTKQTEKFNSFVETDVWWCFMWFWEYQQ